MKNTPLSTLAVTLLSLISVGASGETRVEINPPQLKLTTIADVNLFSGFPSVTQPTVTIGGERGLSHEFFFSGHAFLPVFFTDSYKGNIAKVVKPGCIGNVYPNCGHFAASFGGATEIFIEDASGFYPFTSSGATLVRDPSNGGFIYTMGDGTKYFANLSVTGETTSTTPRDNLYITQVLRPDGQRLQITYLTATHLTSSGDPRHTARVTGVSSNFGYKLKYQYSSNSYPTALTVSSWEKLTSIVAFNSAIDYCEDASVSCTFSEAWPTATFSTFTTPDSHELTIVDQLGGISKYLTEKLYPDEWRLTRIKPSTSPSNYTRTFEYDSYIHCSYGDGIGAEACNRVRSNIVKTSTGPDGVNTFNYQKIPGPGASLDPDNPVMSRWVTTAGNGFGTGASILYSNSSRGGLESAQYRTPQTGSNAATYTNNLLSSYVADGGAQFSYLYDARGNVTHRRQHHATDSNEDLWVQADFDPVCSNVVKCNKPNWLKDARGNVTDFVYDAVHGGVLKTTEPANQQNVRAQTRNSYVQRFAWIKTAGGGYAQADSPLWLIDEIRFCKNGDAHPAGSGCSIPGDEVVTKFDYGPDAGPNNLLLRGKTVSAGAVVQRSCYSYDIRGNRTTHTSPNAGLGTCP